MEDKLPYDKDYIRQYMTDHGQPRWEIDMKIDDLKLATAFAHQSPSARRFGSSMWSVASSRVLRL